MELKECVVCQTAHPRKIGRMLNMVFWSVRGQPVCSTKCAGELMQDILDDERKEREVKDWLRGSGAVNRLNSRRN